MQKKTSIEYQVKFIGYFSKFSQWIHLQPFISPIKFALLTLKNYLETCLSTRRYLSMRWFNELFDREQNFAICHQAAYTFILKCEWEVGLTELIFPPICCAKIQKMTKNINMH